MSTESIRQISKVTFETDCYFGGRKEVVLTRDEAGNMARSEAFDFLTPDPWDIPIPKEVFEGVMEELHFEEWKKTYDITESGVHVCDGTVWKLNIEYADGREPLEFSGYCLYPPTFSHFADMIGYSDPDEECEDEEEEEEEEDES